MDNKNFDGLLSKADQDDIEKIRSEYAVWRDFNSFKSSLAQAQNEDTLYPNRAAAAIDFFNNNSELISELESKKGTVLSPENVTKARDLFSRFEEIENIDS